ncbi:SDR family oxidoreductase [Brevundimonas vesicularis]|uniref:SDR family oxidoreductase n=1 Tax=Brevundimonas vesicularis TaxID=41276 RepID=UPI0028A63090|nr:SDR family oxidoreductase [Brevundimonas vesicularis]
MIYNLKPLSEQTIVITGATSGHGLATARQAARAGANVFLIARNLTALELVSAEIEAEGGKVDFAACDVGDERAVEAAADQAVERFGRIDTWVNNAGVGIYGQLEKVSTEDHRKVFETNYWGVVFGSLSAAKRLKRQGGALINIGSINADMPSPVLSAYTASKHAVKGFTNSLRLELIASKAPISVTLIKPSAIGTPFPSRAGNVTGYRPRLPPPVYAPELVANAILYAAQHARRSITVGGVGKFQVLGAAIFPKLFDRVGSQVGSLLLDKTERVTESTGSLHQPVTDGDVDGDQNGRPYSAYTTVRTNRLLAYALLSTGVGAAGALAMKAYQARGCRPGLV